MTKYYQDIIKQPAQLQQSLAYNLGEGLQNITEAVAIIRASKYVYISGIGASFPVILADAAELLHHSKIPPNSVIIILSRSGKSIEIVSLVNKFHEANGKVIAITNNVESVLAKDCDASLFTSVDFDHSISVNTYTSIILTGLLLAIEVTDVSSLQDYNKLLNNSFIETERRIAGWQNQLQSSDWLNETGYYYFLARGASLSSAYESMLLWHEVVKMPTPA